ncbi:MAG: hypothetical protein RBS73_16810 [Prolixibacteraceae bacterium]|jgi:hypothetical protein|nr:hypothetical protein [Prolixibacteraceae bacterium]
MKSFTGLLVFLFLFSEAFPQGNPDDDGGYFEPHPNKNIIIAPGLLGPNALPVQRIRKGLIGSDFKLQVNQSSHFMKGDNTFNIDGYLLAPVVRNFMALETQWYMFEMYRSSNEIRDWRRLSARDEGTQIVLGDLNFSFLMQFVQNHKWLPDVMGTIGHKTTLGPVEDGHFTNTPALWASLHFGKDLLVRNDFRFRTNGLLGFYVYHSNREKITQNEGPVMGIEAQFNYKNFELASSLSGYSGWEAVGHDDPVYWIVRLEKHRRRVDWHIKYQTGINDYPYETVRIGFTWHLPSFLDFREMNWKEVLKNE